MTRKAQLTAPNSFTELSEYERLQREIDALEAKKAALARQTAQFTSSVPPSLQSPRPVETAKAPRCVTRKRKPAHVPPFIGLKLSPGGEVERRTVLSYTTLETALDVAKNEGYDRLYTLRGICAELSGEGES